MCINSTEAANSCEGMLLVQSSTVCDYAASCCNSYPGTGQYWRNIVQFKSPADSLPKSSAPLALGNSGSGTAQDPVFTGKAGNKGAYFNLNLTYFSYTGQNGSSAKSPVGGFAANWHKTGTSKQAATVVMTLRYHSMASNQCLFTTGTSSSTPGITGYITPTGHIVLIQQGDSASTSLQSTATLTNGVDYVIGIGWNGASIQGIWIGSSTGEVGVAAFKTATGECSSPLFFGILFDSTVTTASFAHTGTRVYDILIFNKLLSNADMAAIIPVLEARNGIDFTP